MRCLLSCGMLVAWSIGNGMSFLSAAEPSHSLTVHEWGTFTCLQDDHGKAIGGINVDDEPVPLFVHRTGTWRVAAQYSEEVRNFGLPPYSDGKGSVPGDPQVTMRLETPVLYIYPPKGTSARSLPPLKVQVAFHGGLLSEFYPYATSEWLAGQDAPLTQETRSSLEWKNIRLGLTLKPAETEEKVWTIPREVDAPWLEVKAPRQNAEGKKEEISEVERFLFYRGVGHLDSPLSLRYVKAEKLPARLQVLENFREGGAYNHCWLVEVREDGTCAFRELPAFSVFGGKGEGIHGTLKADGKCVTTVDLPLEDFSADNLAKLKTSMQAALEGSGLYPSEASGMLRTWELSYFKTPGMRFFYIVPVSWVEKVLPLKIDGASAKITRVMVGRIEMMTDGQRAALARLSAGPCPDLPAFRKNIEEALKSGKFSAREVKAIYRGEKPLGTLGIPIPPEVQDYLRLGRFRDALILHRQQEQPTPALEQFIQENRLLVRP